MEPSQEQKIKIKKFVKEAFNREISDAEVLECHLSLFFYARAKIRYLQIKQGLISPDPKGASNE